MPEAPARADRSCACSRVVRRRERRRWFRALRLHEQPARQSRRRRAGQRAVLPVPRGEAHEDFLVLSAMPIVVGDGLRGTSSLHRDERCVVGRRRPAGACVRSASPPVTSRARRRSVELARPKKVARSRARSPTSPASARLEAARTTEARQLDARGARGRSACRAAGQAGAGTARRSDRPLARRRRARATRGSTARQRPAPSSAGSSSSSRPKTSAIASIAAGRTSSTVIGSIELARHGRERGVLEAAGRDPLRERRRVEVDVQRVAVRRHPARRRGRRWTRSCAAPALRPAASTRRSGPR